MTPLQLWRRFPKERPLKITRLAILQGTAGTAEGYHFVFHGIHADPPPVDSFPFPISDDEEGYEESFSYGPFLCGEDSNGDPVHIMMNPPDFAAPPFDDFVLWSSWRSVFKEKVVIQADNSGK